MLDVFGLGFSSSSVMSVVYMGRQELGGLHTLTRMLLPIFVVGTLAPLKVRIAFFLDCFGLHRQVAEQDIVQPDAARLVMEGMQCMYLGAVFFQGAYQTRLSAPYHSSCFVLPISVNLLVCGFPKVG